MSKRLLPPKYPKGPKRRDSSNSFLSAVSSLVVALAGFGPRFRCVSCRLHFTPGPRPGDSSEGTQVAGGLKRRGLVDIFLSDVSGV
eukprot:scaffold9682_cov126-Skeletonema_dohrnii-CCMP3373.AAC.2